MESDGSLFRYWIQVLDLIYEIVNEMEMKY